MLKNKKVVIFDMDGTLIDSMGIWSEIDEKLIQTISNVEIPKIDFGEERDRKLKEYSSCEDPYLEYCNFLKNKYQSNKSKEGIKKIRYEIADSYLREKIDYKEDAEKMLKYLKNKGFTLVIASTTGNNAIDIYKNHNKNIINKANLSEIFSLIYSKEAVREMKPNPEVHHKILKELNVKPEECLIVEDSIIGVEAANRANIEVAVIYDKYSNCNREEINRLSQYQFMNFKEMIDYIKKELKDNI